MKRFVGLLATVLFVSLTAGCFLNSWGPQGVSGFRPTSARDLVDYSAWDYAEGTVLVRANSIGSLPDPPISAMDAPDVEEYPKQWGLQAINAEAAWEITQGDENVILAIIDSGVDGAHPEFAGKTFLEGFDALGKNEEYIDPNGHGTHVAGIAADDGRTGSMAGVAWKSPIMSLRVANAEGRANISDITEALLYLGDYAADTKINA